MLEKTPVAEVLTAAEEPLFHAYRLLKEYGAWPKPGGWLRQTALFMEAVDICDQARGLYAARRQEKDEEAKRLADLMAGMGKK